jgi:hypothetical protein
MYRTPTGVCCTVRAGGVSTRSLRTGTTKQDLNKDNLVSLSINPEFDCPIVVWLHNNTGLLKNAILKSYCQKKVSYWQILEVGSESRYVRSLLQASSIKNPSFTLRFYYCSTGIKLQNWISLSCCWFSYFIVWFLLYKFHIYINKSFRVKHSVL